METIETAPVKPPITIDDLDKLDIRVGRIVRVDDVEGSKKLIKMTVSFGGFTRTILSGMRRSAQIARPSWRAAKRCSW